MDNQITIIPAADISSSLTDYTAIEKIIQEAYLAHGKHLTIVPDSQFLFFPAAVNSRIITLLSYIDGEHQIAGIKSIASFPANIEKGIPRANAVIILHDTQTGIPYAILEGSVISALRTASSAVLAAYYLNNKVKKIQSIGFVGNGVIAKNIYQTFTRTGWQLDEVYLFDFNKATSQKFETTVCEKEKHTSIKIATTCDELMERCDVIVFATTSVAPYINNLFNRQPLILHISLRDLSPAIILQARNFTDDPDHAVKANTSLGLAYQSVGHKEFIDGTIVDLIEGKAKVKTASPRIFSPFGLGVLDLAIAHYVFRTMQDKGTIRKIENFFPV